MRDEALSMRDAAERLGLLAGDLDVMLWARLGESPETLAAPVRRLHEADF